MGKFVSTIQPEGSSDIYSILIDDDSQGKAVPREGNSYFQINDKPNLTITTPKKLSNGKGGKLNLEADNDISIKPADDINFEAHHRDEGKQREISTKYTDGGSVEGLVKHQVHVAEIVYSTDGKENTMKEDGSAKLYKDSEKEVLDITINAKDKDGSTAS